ncbi:MAG: hypothetical protein LKG26_05865 [Saccharofermentans sp.]|jgi:DNA replication protein DnaC|nr:hypothetical protein [Mageeibacillus sp.]MCI1263923.1 hypothetical protein [Saccharofermentans sp.]MCI1275594.1 hypothetical protein [Saccharofermentans sp.]MCI1768864.1 hypothetical protein [Mageeibacillus sp.]
MKTIKQAIDETKAEIAAEREIRRDRRIADIYARYPELEQCDKDIVVMKSNILIALIEKDDALRRRLENDLKAKIEGRDRILEENGIDPRFDDNAPVCDRCNDTGFYTDKNGNMRVCGCKSKELRECFDSCGLRNYSSFSIRNYKDDYLGNASGRKNILQSLLSTFLSSKKPADSMITIYYGAPQTGKTYLSVCIAKAAIELGKSAYYTKCEDFADKDKAELEEISAVDLLVIDDFSDDITLHNNVGSILNNILEFRDAGRLPTILVTSIPSEILVKGSDMRVAGKIRKAGVIS